MIQRSTKRLSIPSTLERRLAAFRSTLLARASLEMFGWIVLSSLVACAALFFSDRWLDTPSWLRWVLLLAVGVVAVGASLKLARRFVESYGLLRIAKLVRRRDALFGDHLVGALELAESETEQARSASLCAGALEQVAGDAEQLDWMTVLPEHRTLLAWQLVGIMLVPVGIGLAIYPEAVSTTLRRLAPWSGVERFTFARIETLPERIIVPHDEPHVLRVSLAGDSDWNPEQATLRLSGSVIRSTRGDDSSFQFEVPGVIEPAEALIRVGDCRRRLMVMPKLRPELHRVEAVVALPEYLNLPESRNPIRVDLRGGLLEVVRGSQVVLKAEASAPLQAARVDGRDVTVDRRSFTAPLSQLDGETQIEWLDEDGLASKQPFRLQTRTIDDRKPSLIIESGRLPPRVLNDQQLAFKLFAEDDFAVTKVGMEWVVGDNLIFGERVLGGSRDPQLQVDAVFQATAFDLEPGEVSLRFWVTDDLPGREKVYSEPLVLDVVSKDEHAIWIGNEFDRWRQAAMDIRDRELMLFERNRELAATPPSQRDEVWRDKLAEQAREETLNGRLLAQLAAEGTSLIRQAARNSEVESSTIETLAQTVQVLQGMATERMPRVAKLLKEAGEEESKFAEMVDQETSQAAVPEEKPGGGEKETPEGESGRERIGLAGTTIADTSGRKSDPVEPEEKSDQLQDAVEDQEQLVAEFDAVADEMSQLLGRMEGSTLIKRLKAVSRIQDRIATELGRNISDTFGVDPQEVARRMDPVRELMVTASIQARTAVDDLEAFYERRELEHFGVVLDEIKAYELLNRFGDMKDRLEVRPGRTIADAEYWADNLDRWADDLVDPGKREPEQDGQKNRKSLSPKTILEVLRILEAEVNLREQTRVAEQGRAAMERDDYMAEAIRLSESQDVLRDRVDQIVYGLQSQPDAALHYQAEMDVLGAASAAMVDARKTLVSPETGKDAIAAETEAIELLLRAKKVHPSSGGGGGSQAGGGAGGTTDQAAIALIGNGLDQLANRRTSETKFAVGRSRNDIPEPWLKGIQTYHQRLEQRRASKAEASP